MKASRIRKGGKKRGSALVSMMSIMFLLAVGTGAYVQNTTQVLRVARRQEFEIQSTHLCEAGIQSVLLSLWRPFKVSQSFVTMDATCTGATTGSPLATISSSITGAGCFSAGVISYSTPAGDAYTRSVTIRCVGWVDLNGNGQLDPGEPQKVVDVIATYQLARSQVFDYTYFINNYGWMDGFGVNDLVVNGDMRANGNFNFTNGSPTVNGSVYATANDKLTPAAAGLVNTPPVKQSNANYLTAAAADSRMRQGYNSAMQGAKGTAQYEQWRDYIFESNASIVNNRTDGAVIGDATGLKSWNYTATNSTLTTSMLDSNPTKEVVMPDLSDLTHYTALSQNYVDQKSAYLDGTANPNYGLGAFVKVWNTSTGAYQTISTNGVVTGSAAVVGTSDHPVIIHGPVTFTQDAVVKGSFSGQGTIYTGRNVHIVGSIVYKNPPSFIGANQTTIDQTNEKKDLVAFAARGSVIMGDTSQFTNSYPLQYMSPPFTHARLDDYGNTIPAFDATQTDSTGFKKYQSVLGDSYIHSISSSVNQMDAVLYTNFVGGGDIGTGGGGVVFNGTIISKDEAMVIFSLPMKMNYDSRIREKTLSSQPLIDLQLPRSPVMLRSAWQDRGFYYNVTTTG